MLKRIAAAALICTIALTGAACSSNTGKNDASSTPAASASASTSSSPEASPTENADISKTQAFIAARLAEEKVNFVFHQDTSEDDKPILNALTPDKESAAKLLNAYIDPALTEKILAYYLTDEKADNAIVVKSDKFFTASILAAATRDELTFEGEQNEFKMTTKDGGVFTAKKNTENTFVLSDFSKK